jgi:hypothetical protein
MLTCVYCGYEYPDGTPPSNSSVLTEHISKCDKHPMKVLRDALAFYARSLDASDAGGVFELWERDNFGKRARDAFENLNLSWEKI